MDRRVFIGGIACVALPATLGVSAQERAKAWRIGFLREGTEPIGQPLVEALRGLGWVDGRNIAFEQRFAGHADQLPELAADLVRRKVDLIITGGTGPTRAAKQATADIPIVFSVGGDPAERGLVGSMAHPGGNLTGFALGIYDEKQLQILKATLPRITRVAYPVFPGADPSALISRVAAVSTLGVEIQYCAVQVPDDFEPFFAAAKDADAALIPDVARLIPHLKRIASEVSKNRLPAMGFRRVFAEAGGLLSYGPLISEQSMRMAMQIDRILKGAKPAELPVERPTRFELVINLREAKALGVSIPQPIRLAADELIQ